VKRISDVLAALAAGAIVACSKPDAGPAHADADPLRCATCHTPEFNATSNPPHSGARPMTCGVCHTQSSWNRWRVEHPGWQLTGAHARAAAEKNLAGVDNRVKCFWCHRGTPPTFAGTKQECFACHEEDRVAVRYPGHDTFSLSCETCHSTEAWKPAKKPPPAAPSAITSAPTTTTTDAGARTVATAPSRPRPPPVKPTPPPSTPHTAPTPTPTKTVPPPPDVTSHASRRR
jgi:hypothetical protein